MIKGPERNVLLREELLTFDFVSFGTWYNIKVINDEDNIDQIIRITLSHDENKTKRWIFLQNFRDKL